MAVTITRSIWIDDDGTGTTGTVINQALHTTLYNEIDAALAKVPQLAGGNTFTGGNQVVNGGSVYINGTVPPYATRLCVFSDLVNSNGFVVQNLNASNGGNIAVFANSVNGVAGTIVQLSANAVAYNTSSDRRLKQDRGRATDVSALRGVVVHDFTWTADGVPARGVFAQEAHAVFPSAITVGTDETTPDGTLAQPWMTDYSKFVPDLIVGWQQHDADLTELRAMFAAVKG